MFNRFAAIRWGFSICHHLGDAGAAIRWGGSCSMCFVFNAGFHVYFLGCGLLRIKLKPMIKIKIQS